VEITAFAAFFIGQALISGHAPTADLGRSGVLRALVGCGLDAALIGLFGLALGVLIRSAAGAITILVAVLFVLPSIALALPTSVQHPVEENFEVEKTQIIGTDLRMVEQITGKLIWPRALLAGASGGAWFGLLFGLLKRGLVQRRPLRAVAAGGR
jgi:hypothetical protein